MIYERWAEDDMDALLVANAVEDAEGDVICLTPNGQETYFGALSPHTKFIVWFRVKDHDHGDMIDKAIEKARDNLVKQIQAKRKALTKEVFNVKNFKKQKTRSSKEMRRSWSFCW